MFKMLLRRIVMKILRKTSQRKHKRIEKSYQNSVSRCYAAMQGGIRIQNVKGENVKDLMSNNEN